MREGEVKAVRGNHEGIRDVGTAETFAYLTEKDPNRALCNPPERRGVSEKARSLGKKIRAHRGDSVRSKAIKKPGNDIREGVCHPTTEFATGEVRTDKEKGEVIS